MERREGLIVNKMSKRPSAAELEELRLESERQHANEASRKHYWKVATPVFIIAGLVALAAVVLWAYNAAGSVSRGDISDIEPDFTWLAANWIWVALIAVAVIAAVVPVMALWVQRQNAAAAATD